MAARNGHGFSLIELLVVIAMLALLVTIILPSLSAARELARVARATAELRGVWQALEMYASEHRQTYPPERSWCSADLWEHSAQLPVELADGGYLPSAPQGSPCSSGMEDVFHSGYTYKYKRPGWGLHNGAAVHKSLWVPDAFPNDPPEADPASLPRTKYNNLSTPLDDAGQPVPCPIRYALWSVGPGYDPSEGSPPLAPAARSSWYSGPNSTGVVPFVVLEDGQFITYFR